MCYNFGRVPLTVEGLKLTLSKLSERTVVPLSFVIVLGGGVYWFTSLYALAHNNAAEITELKQENKQLQESLKTQGEVLAGMKATQTMILRKLDQLLEIQSSKGN